MSQDNIENKFVKFWGNELYLEKKVDYRMSQKIDKNVAQIFIYNIFINSISSMIYSILLVLMSSPPPRVNKANLEMFFILDVLCIIKL